ncbi:MAG: septum site-determining protein MinC, partial [Rhodocyclaceae bacterium]|nr:septum site-determining protein MinC [Rhodocyclaceae bacterium]
MTDASTAKPVEFKGGTLTVTSALLRETEPARLADALHVMLGGMPDFFSGETLVLDFSALAAAPERIDWTGLLSLLRRYQTQPVAARHLPEHLVAGARQAGLAILGDDDVRPAATRPAPEPVPEPKPAAPAPTAATRGPTVFVDRPLRSGQQVYAR